MPELLIYPREELPPELNWQIISFLRIRAPHTFAGLDWLKYWAYDEEKEDDQHLRGSLCISDTVAGNKLSFVIG